MVLISNSVEGNRGYFDAKASIQRSSILVNLPVQKNMAKKGVQF